MLDACVSRTHSPCSRWSSGACSRAASTAAMALWPLHWSLRMLLMLRRNGGFCCCIVAVSCEVAPGAVFGFRCICICCCRAAGGSCCMPVWFGGGKLRRRLVSCGASTEMPVAAWIQGLGVSLPSAFGSREKATPPCWLTRVDICGWQGRRNKGMRQGSKLMRRNDVKRISSDWNCGNILVSFF